MKRFTLFLIKKYQQSGGSKRWFGIECNFEPTCSKFTFQAIEEFGLRTGVRLGIKRIKACSNKDSFCKCIDPIPNNNSKI